MPRAGKALVTIWTFAILAFAGGEAPAWNTARRAAAEVRRAEAELGKLTEHPLAAVAKGEIALLESWIETAREALAARRHRRAAMLAERLSRQVALVRALLAVAEEEARARELEEEADGLRGELAALRGKLERWESVRLGGAATWAYPPLPPEERGP